MSTKPTTPQPAEVSYDKIVDALANMFAKVITLRDITDNRNRCFGLVANFRSPKSGMLAVDAVGRDGIGDVLNRISAIKLSAIAGNVEYGF